MKPHSTATFLMLMTAMTCFAQQDPEKEEMKRQIAELKQSQKQMQDLFDKKIADLEKKLESKSEAKKQPEVKFNGLLQSRLDFDSAAADSFYSRRMELKFSQQLNDRFGWTVMVDPAKELKLNGAGTAINQNSKILQDAYVTFNFGQGWVLDLGQKKIPVSYEALMPTSEVDLAERALFSSQGKLADVRDIGAQLSFKRPEFQVTAAALNGLGESQNTKDANDQKSFGGRAVFTPTTVKGLHLGTSAIAGTGPNGTKSERYGYEAQYKNGEWTFRSELVSALDANVRARGAYIHAGYKFAPQWEALARYDTFDPNRQLAGDDLEDRILGLNYWMFDEKAKLQFNWVDRKTGSGTHRSLWQFGLQVKW